MRVVLQRVKSASCTIGGQVYSEIKQGFLLLVGFTHTDNTEKMWKIAKKISGLRIFSDAEGKLNLSLADVNGEVLSISQFTLYANTKKGNRPSFIEAMGGEEAAQLYAEFNRMLSSFGLKVQTGVFGADMLIDLANDGPVTILFEE